MRLLLSEPILDLMLWSLVGRHLWQAGGRGLSRLHAWAGLSGDTTAKGAWCAGSTRGARRAGLQ